MLKRRCGAHDAIRIITAFAKNSFVIDMSSLQQPPA
jgi:hypothetical protein